MSFTIPIPGFGERAPGPEARQGALDLWAELFGAVDNVAIAAEASQPGVTGEPLGVSEESQVLQAGDVLSLEEHRAKRDLGRGTIVAAADVIRRQASKQDIAISEALANVYDAYDNPERAGHAS